MSAELCPVQLRMVGEDRIGLDFLLLEDERGRRLPIYIDRCQAAAIYFKLKSVQMPRPMTHDLLCNSVERLGGRITRVIIDDIWQNTFYAKICLAGDDGEEELQVDCRPSDALSVAIRVDVPILVRDDVLEEEKVPDSPPDGLEEEIEDDDDAE